MEKDDAIDIQNWLESILEDSNYQYEANEQTLSILKQLMLTNIKMDNHAKLELTDIQQKTIEYQQEIKYNKMILDYFGLSPEKLSETGFNSLETLCKLSEKLNLGQAPGNFSESTYIMALCDLKEKLLKLKQMNFDQKQILFDLKMERQNEEENLLKILNDLDEKLKESKADEEEQTKMSKYFNAKNNSYKSRIVQKNKMLTQIGARSSIHHGVLSKVSNEVIELQKTTKEIKKKLCTYQKLPPSLSLLNIKVAEKEVEMAHLEKKMDLLIIKADSENVL